MVQVSLEYLHVVISKSKDEMENPPIATSDAEVPLSLRERQSKRKEKRYNSLEK